ncbi:Uncharacterised protein [Klebsiella pneumoniae]|jgi:hypothetical protein|nr:Uncharacterised protein [Klebsiella pneumoniae]
MVPVGYDSFDLIVFQGHMSLQKFEQHSLLAREVRIERALRISGFLGDIAQGCARETTLNE